MTTNRNITTPLRMVRHRPIRLFAAATLVAGGVATVVVRSGDGGGGTSAERATAMAAPPVRDETPASRATTEAAENDARQRTTVATDTEPVDRSSTSTAPTSTPSTPPASDAPTATTVGGTITTTPPRTAGTGPGAARPAPTGSTAPGEPDSVGRTQATTPTAPTAQDEPESPGPAGVIQQVTSPGSPALVGGPTWEQVDLDLLDPVPGAPVPVPAFQTPGALVAKGYGCTFNCVERAVLTPRVWDADVGIELVTTVPTQAYVYVSQTEPAIGPHGPVMTVWPSPFHLDEKTTWTAETSGMVFDTTYWISILVIDDEGNEYWASGSYRTAPDPTDVEIQQASVYHTDEWDTVDLVLVTNVDDPTIELAVSTLAPIFVDGVPLLANQVPWQIVQDGGNDVRIRISQLDAETTYHVKVLVENEVGYAKHAVGTFHTDPKPLVDARITWERVWIEFDGDPGGYGKGEISMAWGLGFEDNSTITAGTRGEEKIGDGTSVVLDAANWAYSVVPEDGELPSIIVNVMDREGSGKAPSGHCLTRLLFENGGKDCTSSTSVAIARSPRLDDVRALPKCHEFGVPAARSDDYCMTIRSVRTSTDHPAFDALVSIHLTDV